MGMKNAGDAVVYNVDLPIDKHMDILVFFASILYVKDKECSLQILARPVEGGAVL